MHISQMTLGRLVIIIMMYTLYDIIITVTLKTSCSRIAIKNTKNRINIELSTALCVIYMY